jgi:hypothetical protein
MRTSTWFLSASLVVNALLIGLVLQRTFSGFAAGPSYSVKTPPNGPVAAAGSQPTNSSNHAAKPDHTAVSSQSAENLWSRLDSEDFDRLVQNLRTAGFPPRLIRRLLLDLVQARGEIARAAVQGKSADMPYWKTVQYFPDDPALRAKIREINMAGNKVLAKYLHDPAIVKEEEFSATYLKQRFGDLPTETLQALLKIQADYWELIDEATKAARSGADRQRTPEERAKVALIKAEQRKDIEALLTPEQFEQYELRSSPTAEQLRSRLDTFRPTEAEYKAIFRLQREVDQRFNIDDDSDVETKRASTEAMKTLAPQIEAALGSDRYADYLQATTPGANQLNRLLTRLDLPLRTATQLESVRTDITQRAKTIRADQQLTPVERDLRLSALANEAKTKLTATLGGPRGLEAYADIKGDWLRALQPKPSTSSP